MDNLSSLLDAVNLLLDSSVLYVLFIGVVVGLVIGVLPGLGGPVPVAMTLPFIYEMSPPMAFALLLAMLAATSSSSDVTSVLFGVPGDVSAAATVLDGHPLAVRGEAGRAIGITLTSSLIGGIIGALILALCIPIARPLVLSFASPEVLILSILGLLLVATLNAGRTLEGCIMATFGLLISTVGLDSQSGTPRFSFDQLYLWDGINLVPFVVGLFALPELMRLIRKRAPRKGKVTTELAPEFPVDVVVEKSQRAGLIDGVKDTLRHKITAFRSSVIGALVGLIPGVGGSVSQWIAYGDAKHRSRAPEKFGDGAPDGLVAATAVNNGRDGGQLVPTLAFGVPGSGTMAVFLGAFLIMGLVPGPSMLSENLDLTYMAMLTIVVATVISILLIIPLVKPLARLAAVRSDVLAPGILIVVVFAACVTNSAWGDVFVLLIFGAVGVLGIAYSWPIVPLLLGFVLGGLIEQNMHISFAAYGSSWLTRPQVMGMVILTCLAIAVTAIRRRKVGKKTLIEEALDVNESTQKRRSLHDWIVDTAICLGLILVFVIAFFMTNAWPSATALFPRWCAIVGIVFGAIKLVLLVREYVRETTRPSSQKGPDPTPTTLGETVPEALGSRVAVSDSAVKLENRLITPVATCWIAAYFATIMLLGVLVGSTAFVFVYLVRHARIGLIGASAYAFAVYLFLWFFTSMLRMPLPMSFFLA